MSGLAGLLSALPVETVIGWIARHAVKGAVAIAHQLARPHLSAEGVPRVPKLTEAVLKHFGDHPSVQDAFVCGSGGRHYEGDIAAEYDVQARVAEKFLNHDLPAVGLWARHEVEQSRQSASRHRQMVAEWAVPA